MATRRPPHPKWPRCVTARPRARHTWPATVAALLVAAVALSLPTHSAGKTPGEIVCTPSETWSVFVTYATPDEANHIEYTLNGVLTVQVRVWRPLWPVPRTCACHALCVLETCLVPRACVLDGGGSGLVAERRTCRVSDTQL